jgi:hypothetical protein
MHANSAAMATAALLAGSLSVGVMPAAAVQSCDPAILSICISPGWEDSDGDICALIGVPIEVYGPDPRFPIWTWTALRASQRMCHSTTAGDEPPKVHTAS